MKEIIKFMLILLKINSIVPSCPLCGSFRLQVFSVHHNLTRFVTRQKTLPTGRKTLPLQAISIFDDKENRDTDCFAILLSPRPDGK